MTPSSNQLYNGPKLAPTPVSGHQYLGVTLDPKRHGSLASHGALITSSVPSRDIYNRQDIQAAESLTTLRSARGSSTLGHHPHAGTNDSPFSSESEIHPSSGVPLNQSDNTMPTMTLPQNANFAQLAEHREIHKWNNSVFDDRWLLQPEEVWNLGARRESVVTVSPERLAMNRNTLRTGDQMELRTEESQRSSTQNTHTQRLVGETGESQKRLRGHQASNAPTEARWDKNSDTLAAGGKLATAQKANHIKQ